MIGIILKCLDINGICAVYKPIIIIQHATSGVVSDFIFSIFVLIVSIFSKNVFPASRMYVQWYQL